MRRKVLFLLSALLLTAQIMLAQGVLTTDAMIRLAEQESKKESALTLVVKVADEKAADTYARLRQLGVTIRGRIGQQAIVQVPIDKVETVARMDGILRVDIGHQGTLKTDIAREVTGVNDLNGSNPTVPLPYTGKGVTICVVDMGIDFNHPAFKDEQGRSRIKCVYNMISDKGRKFVFDDPVAGPIEFPGSVFDTPELIAKLVYDTKQTTHGCHTTGIAAGSLSPQGFGGMAPDADIVFLPISTLFTEDDVDTDTSDTDTGMGSPSDPDPSEIDQTDMIVEQYLAFANAYAQLSEQPVVLSASLGSHMGPHNGTGTVPEAISALSQHAIPVFSSGNEGGDTYHVYYQFENDKPSFNVGCSPSLTKQSPDDDPANPFIWSYIDKIRGYTRVGQSGQIGLQLNVVAHVNKQEIIDCPWSSPVFTATLGGPDQIVTVNSADDPEAQNYFRGKVYLSIRTLESGQLELTVIPNVVCKESTGVAHYGLTLTVTGSPGTAVDLWQNLYRFVHYTGEGYIFGDDVISGSDWTSTPDVISVGAWCSNTTSRAFIEGMEDTESAGETQGDIAKFSSYGTMFNGVTQPTVCAPGVNVVSAWNQYFLLYGPDVPTTYVDGMTWQGYPYGVLSGTSMSCPAAAGIIALWLEANPQLTLADVKDILAHSSDNDTFTVSNPARWGFGKINAKKGLEYLQASGIVEVSDGRSMMSDSWYTLDGRRLNGKPAQRGIYIYKDKKTIIK